MDWSNLKADYERLGSYSAVAAEYGVSKGYVAQPAKKQGINPKPEGRSLAIDWSGLPALYDSGMTTTNWQRTTGAASTRSRTP